MIKYKIAKPKKIEKLEGTQRIILDLANGVRKPKNKKEEKLLKEIKEIEKNDRMIDLPFE